MSSSDDPSCPSRIYPTIDHHRLFATRRLSSSSTGSFGAGGSAHPGTRPVPPTHINRSSLAPSESSRRLHRVVGSAQRKDSEMGQAAGVTSASDFWKGALSRQNPPIPCAPIEDRPPTTSQHRLNRERWDGFLVNDGKVGPIRNHLDRYRTPLSSLTAYHYPDPPTP